MPTSDPKHSVCDIAEDKRRHFPSKLVVEASAHEACSSVSSGCVGDIEILGGLLQHLVLFERASGIEAEEMWTVNPHSDRVALDALHDHFGSTHTLVGVLW